MVIFQSYVSLPEGNVPLTTQNPHLGRCSCGHQELRPTRRVPSHAKLWCLKKRSPQWVINCYNMLRATTQFFCWEDPQTCGETTTFFMGQCTFFRGTISDLSLFVRNRCQSFKGTSFTSRWIFQCQVHLPLNFPWLGWNHQLCHLFRTSLTVSSPLGMLNF